MDIKKFIAILIAVFVVTVAVTKSLSATEIPDYNTCAIHDIMSQKALYSADEWMDIAEVGKGEGTDVAEKRAKAAEKVYKYHHKNYLNCLEGAR